MKPTVLFSIALYGLPFLVLIPPFRHRLWVATWLFWVLGFCGVVIDFLNSPSATSGSLLPMWMICGPMIGVAYSAIAMAVIEGTRQLHMMRPALKSARERGFSGTALWKEASQEIVRSRKSLIVLPALLQPARIVAVFIATFGFLLLSAPILGSRPRTGENLPGVSWLPKEATRVSFHKSRGKSFYEFDIPENSFKQWVGQRQFTGTTNTTGSVTRFTSVLSNGKPGTGASQATQAITNGLLIERKMPDGSGFVVGYDRGLGRAFVAEQSH